MSGDQPQQDEELITVILPTINNENISSQRAQQLYVDTPRDTR